MRAKFSFSRALSLALVAVGTVSGLSTDAFAATRTWVGTAAGTGNSGKWGTTSTYAANWNPATTPTAADTGIFGGASAKNVTVANNSMPIGQMLFNGTGKYTFLQSGSLGSIAISGDGNAPNVGISMTAVPSGNNAHEFDVPVILANSTVRFNAASNGGTETLNLASGVDLAGNYLATAGDLRIGGLVSSVAGGQVEATSQAGRQRMQFSNASSNVSALIVNGGTISTTGNTSATNLTVSGGTYVDSGNFANATVSSGLMDLSNNANMNVGAFVQSAGGTLRMDVQNDLTNSHVASTSYQLGGAFQLDGSDLLNNLYPLNTTWNLFSGVNFTSGTASPTNGSSNFSSFAFSTSSSASPYYGTWTRFGQEWTSPKATDGTFMVFQAATGNLVVVPEPSTMVFAGLGVAMSGWTMWKKRRLAKLLVAKAG